VLDCLTLENKSVDFDSQACVNAFGLRFYFYLHMRIYLTVYYSNKKIALGELHSIHESEYVKGKQCEF